MAAQHEKRFITGSLTYYAGGTEGDFTMFKGHVDSVTRAAVTGWAADSDDPNSAVEISIFLDGRKISQVECGLSRPDLQQLGDFGDGMHGFRFEFPQPLGQDADRRVTLRFSATGKTLGNGDVEISRDDSTRVRTRPTARFIGEPGPIPAPRDPRGLLEVFALFDETGGIYELLSRLDFEGMKPRHPRFLVFGDLAESAADYVPTRTYSPRDHLNELLLSDEFQQDLIPLCLKSFPEKQRIIFIHVPKCAGTDLSANLMSRLPFLHQSMTEPDWLSSDKLMRAISRFVLNIRFFDQIFVAGHNSLQYYASHDLIRPCDKAFTILRDPIEIAVSQINYVMTRLTADAQSGEFGPDTRGWLKALSLSTLPPKLPPATVQNLCTTILHNTSIVRPNSMCAWLGGEDAETAVAQLIKHDVEVTVTDNYNDWLQQTWGIVSTTRLNRSERFKSTQTMSHQDLNYVQELCAEDIKLYTSIHEALQRKKSLSVSGDDLR
jgi:hypothetical protein